MTDNWKADADVILIFVSSHSTSDLSTHVNPKIKDWFILCCRRYIGSGVRAGPQAKFPGHLIILPCQYLPNPSQSEWFPRPHAFHTSRSVDSFSSAKLCGLGQLALVPQPDHQPPMPTLGDITATIGTSIHGGCPDAIQTTQGSADPGVLFRGRRQPSPSGCWGIFRLVAPFSVPLNEWSQQSLRVRPFSSVRPSFLVLILIPLEDPGGT